MKGEPEPSDSYMLHDEDGEEFRLPKTSRTLREMDLLEEAPEKENEVGDQATMGRRTCQAHCPAGDFQLVHRAGGAPG